MFMNKISDDMLKTLLSGDMKEIAEKLTETEMNDNGIIIDYWGKDDSKKDPQHINLYINIANFIYAHCTTSEKTDAMNRFLAKNDCRYNPFSGEEDSSYWNKFYKVCDVLELSPSRYIGGDESGYNTYNYDNDLSTNFLWRILEDEYGTYYVLISIHLGGDIRGNYSDTVLLELNDIDYFYRHTIDGYVRETEQDYEGEYDILQNTVKIENDCLYNAEGYEIILNACLEY